MIRIYRPEKTKVTLRGHAGSAEHGHDLICAAVSALVLTLAYNVADFPQPKLWLDPGDTQLACPAAAEAVQAFDCIWKGFQLLAELYPEYIQIEN